MSSLSRAGTMVLGSRGSTKAAKTPEEVINAIRVHVQRYRIRLQDRFKDFDKQNTGVISRSNFDRALDIALKGMGLSNADANIVVKQYEQPWNHGAVNYKEFCIKINPHMRQGLEKDPLARPDSNLSVAGLPRINGIDVLTTREKEAVEQKLAQMRAVVSSQSSDPASYFRDFDRSNSGTVTVSQFYRRLKEGFRTLHFDKTTLGALSKMYGTNTNEASYRILCQDIVPTAGSTNSKAPTVRQRPGAVATRSQQENIDFLQKKLIESRTDVTGSFKDFDSLRTGYVQRSQFLSAFKSFTAQFTQPDLDLVADRYQTGPSNTINYKLFLEQIEKKRLLPTRDSGKAFSDDAEWSTVLQKIRSTQSQRGFDMVQPFKDFDKNNQGLVTRTQFLRVLQSFKLDAVVNPMEIELLYQRYSSKGGDRRVNYSRFTRDLRPNQSSSGSFRSSQPVNISAVTKQKPSQVGDVMRKIKDTVRRNRVRIRDFLVDFDPLRSKRVTKNQFRTGLLTSGLQLSPEEQRLLVEKYQDTTQADKVNYDAFCGDVESVFGIKGLERNPQADPIKASEAALNDDIIDPEQRLNTSEENELRSLLKDLESYVQSQTVELKTPFQDFDRSNRGYISLVQFQRALKARVNWLTPQAVKLICKAFAKPKTDSGEYVNYNFFLRAVDDADGVIGNLSAISRGAAKPVVSSAEPYSNFIANRVVVVPDVDVGSVLEKISLELRALQMKPADLGVFCQEFDMLRTGYMPKNKLTTALDKARISLLEGDYNSLQKYYSRNSNTDVNYRDMVEHVSKYYSKQKDQGSVKDSAGVTAMLKELVKQNRIEVKGAFKSRDRLRQQKVTVDQFRQVIGFCFPNKLQERDVQMLIKDYSNQRDAYSKRISYMPFLKAIGGE